MKDQYFLNIFTLIHSANNCVSFVIVLLSRSLLHRIFSFGGFYTSQTSCSNQMRAAHSYISITSHLNRVSNDWLSLHRIFHFQWDMVIFSFFLFARVAFIIISWWILHCNRYDCIHFRQFWYRSARASHQHTYIHTSSSSWSDCIENVVAKSKPLLRL